MDLLRGVKNGNSVSGKERNHLFMNVAGKEFVEFSGLSGLDHLADARAVAALDYDRDGWTDFAVVNANTPLFQLFRNQMAASPGASAARHGMLALRFVGANKAAQSAVGKSNRDGYGAVVELRVAGATLLREHRAGEGLAAQSSATELVGLGDATQVDELRVRWPSGRVQTRVEIPAFSLVTIYEDAAESPDGSGFALEPYLRSPRVATAPQTARGQRLLLRAGNGHEGGAPIRLLTTMATWCEVCRGELDQVALLKRTFSADQLDLIGVPVDEDDDSDVLAAYRREHAPAYLLLEPLSDAERADVKKAVVDGLWIDVLPATIVTDREGRVLHTQAKVPSVSQVRRLLLAVSGS